MTTPQRHMHAPGSQVPVVPVVLADTTFLVAVSRQAAHAPFTTTPAGRGALSRASLCDGESGSDGAAAIRPGLRCAGALSAGRRSFGMAASTPRGGVARETAFTASFKAVGRYVVATVVLSLAAFALEVLSP